MRRQAPQDSRASKPKRNRLLFLVALLGCVAGWYFCGDAIKENIDRQIVRSVRYKHGKSELAPGAPSGSLLALPKGKWVKAGPDVMCYGRALSHHALFGFRRGYAYVQVNGTTYGKPEGPCTDTIHLLVSVNSSDRAPVVTEDVVVQALIQAGFQPIP